MKTRVHRQIGTARQLEIFLAVYEAQSITRASKQLFLTQPTVSMQIAKLADTVGFPLYYLDGKRMSFTEAGEIVAAHARSILREYEYLDLALSSMREMEAGQVSLAIVTTAKYFIPHLIGPFSEDHPKVDLSLKIGNREEILHRVERDEDDFYVFSNPPRDQEFELIPFLSNRLVAIAPENHPLAKEQKIPLARFLNEPFLSREEGSGSRNSIERHLQRSGIEYRPRMIIESNEAIRHAVMSNLGVSIVSEHTLNYGGAAGLAVLDVVELPIESSWYLVRRLVRPLSPAAKALQDCLLSRHPEPLR